MNRNVTNRGRAKQELSPLDDQFDAVFTKPQILSVCRIEAIQLIGPVPVFVL